MNGQPPNAWPFVRLGLIVTGETEKQCLPDLFRILTSEGNCHFRVLCRVGQRSPRSARNVAKMVGSGKAIPDRDAAEIGRPARQFLRAGGDYVILVDDLEASRAPQANAVFDRYRRALDAMLGVDAVKAAVHFLVNMLEAYYFADANAVNGVLETSLEDDAGDVESIRHPKNRLKELCPAFDERRDGPPIVRALDVVHILSRTDACASLRTMFLWASEATRSTTPIPAGCLFPITKRQIEDLRAAMDPPNR